MTLLLTLWASKLFRQILAGLLVLFAFWYAIHSYNSYITEEALAENDKVWQKKLDAEQDKHLEFIAEIEVKRAAAVAKGMEDAKAKETKLKQAFAEIQALTKARDTAGRTRSELDSVLNAITAGTGKCGQDSAECRFVTELRRSYASCERDLTVAIGIAGEANDRARKAQLTAEALK
jgi:hypothetical protein